VQLVSASAAIEALYFQEFDLAEVAIEQKKDHNP
jgi:hypothetical protein